MWLLFEAIVGVSESVVSVVCDDDVTMMCDEQARLTRDDFACT